MLVNENIDLSLAPFVRPSEIVHCSIVIYVSRDWLQTTYTRCPLNIVFEKKKNCAWNLISLPWYLSGRFCQELSKGRCLPTQSMQAPNYSFVNYWRLTSGLTSRNQGSLEMSTATAETSQKHWYGWLKRILNKLKISSFCFHERARFCQRVTTEQKPFPWWNLFII